MEVGDKALVIFAWSFCRAGKGTLCCQASCAALLRLKKCFRVKGSHLDWSQGTSETTSNEDRSVGCWVPLKVHHGLDSVCKAVDVALTKFLVSS